MSVCGNCGAQNPDTSLYCQDCGSRLGDWKPAEGPSRSATPPTGLSRAEVASPACPRCGTDNPAGIRFCNNCGYQLNPPNQSSADPSSPGVAVQKTDADGSVCWRCYGVGDPGADFCKFCGARYADAPRPAESSEPKPSPAPAAREPARERAQPATARGAASSAGGSSASSRPKRGSLVSILKDGSDGRRYAIEHDETDIGRSEGQIVLADDPYLSPRHARLAFRAGKPVLRDLDSVNGIYIRVQDPVDLSDGDMMLLGQQVLRFEILAEQELPLGPATQHGAMVFGTPEVQRIARLVQYTTEGVGRDVHYLYRDETVIGREQGDLVFTDDPFMSRRHAAVTVDRAARRFVLRDLGSSNGSAIRFRGERQLRRGDQFRVGRHLFRFEAGQ